MPAVTHNGLSIHFEDEGAGRAVVLGHSFLCSGEMWAPQVPRLAENYRVVNIDLRGHGLSSRLSQPCDIYDLVADVVAVLDHLEIETAVWAGLSIGGMVAMRAALTVPDRVSALVLLDTHAGGETAYKKLKYRAMNLGSRVAGISIFLPAVVSMMFGETTLRERPQLVAEWKRRFSGVHLPSIGIVLGALVNRDSVVERLPEIEAPTAVIVGAEDASLPVACSQQIAEAIPGASLDVIANAGHLSALEQPSAVAAAMLGFLDRLE